MKLHSLRYRIAATIFVLEAVMLTAVLWLSQTSSFEATSKEINVTNQVILKNLSELGRIALLTDEYNDLQPFLEIAVSDPNTLDVLLTNSENIVFASTAPHQLGKKLPRLTDIKNEYWQHMEISNASGVLGNLWIHFSNLKYETAYKNATILGISIAIIGMLIIAIAGLFIGILLTRRLDNLRLVAREYTKGNFAARVTIAGDEEIKELGRTLNQMAEEISHTINSLKESEESFRTIFNFSNDAIFLIDPYKDRIVNVNPAACKLLEYDYQELLKTPVSVIHPDEMTNMRDFVKEVYEEGSSITDELTCLTKHNNQIPVGISASKVTVDGQQYLLAQVRDITERKIFERELASRERLFRTIIKSLPVAICQTDFYGDCHYVNEIWLTQTGMTFEQSMGQGWQKAIHEDDREATLRLLKTNALKEKPWVLEYRFSKPDGEIRNLLGKVVALRDDNNRINGYLGANIDLTDYKQTESALRRSQKMEAVGQLSGGIAHDFNNLMGAILGSIEMLNMQTQFDSKVQKRIDTINHAAQRATDLTKQLLVFSSKEESRSKVTNINSLINNIQTLITQSLTPEVELQLDLSDDLWLADINAGEFEDALINLAVNARDAMEGHGKLSIESCNTFLDEHFCNLHPEVSTGEYIELAVSDNGSGIASEELEHVFEPFYTSKEEGKGTGLGLAMVFGFVKRSQGTIKVYSEPGIGTTFRMYLPRTKLEERRKGVDNQEVDLAPCGNEAILVVDDEKPLLDLMSEFLQSQGYKVFTANNAKLGLAVLEKKPDIDLMITDVVMPGGINGYELAEQALTRYPGLKILLTSGYTKKTVARNGQGKFKENLLSKPYSLKELSLRVKALIDLK